MDGYITLASDANLDLFPENRIGSFRTKLPHPIVTDRTKYKVGLHSITFPNKLPNITDGTFMMRADRGHWMWANGYLDAGTGLPLDDTPIHIDSPCEAPAGFYKSPQDLVDCMNAQILEGPEDVHGVRFAYDTHTEKVSIVIEPDALYDYEIFFCPELFIKLGFGLSESELVNIRIEQSVTMIYTAPHTTDLEVGHASVFIYCDAVEKNRLVGNQITDLLSVVPLVGAHNTNCYHAPPNVEYRSLRYDVLEEISIQLRGDSGRILPFLSGKAILTLHIKEKI